MSTQPNILLIHCDQHRYDCVGANGARIVRTPNLDRLAAEGTNFQRAFCVAPICAPARASLMTGAWPATHGCVNLMNTETYHPARQELPVLTSLLADGGYRVRWIGEFDGEVSGTPTDYGVEEYIPPSLYGQWRAEAGVPPVPSTQGYFGEVDSECPDEKSRLSWQAGHVLRALDELATDEKPFFIRWDPHEPHLPCRPPRESAALYANADVPPWPSFPDPMEGKPWPQKRQHTIWGTRGWNWDQWAPIVRRYYSVITHLDAQIGRILAKLEQQGRLNDTLIIYSTDHGDFCGGHGLIDKHFAMYDDILRVPLIVRWPGLVPAAQVSKAYSSNELDIAATILNAAGIDLPGSFVGQDLVALANGREPSPRGDILVQYFGTASGGYSLRALRNERFKYVYGPTGGDELYDLQQDPGELHNRIDDPALASDLRILRGRLAEWMASVKDPLLNMWTRVHLCGEPSMAQRWQVNTPKP